MYPDFIKKYFINWVIIDTINNLFLKKYLNYTNKAKTTGKDEFKHLIIYFYTVKD